MYQLKVEISTAMNMLMNNDSRIFAVLSSFYIFSYV